jgi:hypothetical protein
LTWEEACGNTSTRWSSSPSVGFSYGTPRLGAIF